MSDDQWTGAEMEFDEAPQRGVHRIKPEDILMREEGVEIEADCPNCQDTTAIQIPWTELVSLAVNKPVPGLRLVRGGYEARAACDSCIERLVEQQVSESRARKGATATITISMDEIFSWIKKGRTAGKISRRQLAFIKQHLQGGRRPRRGPAAAPQPQPPRATPGRPQARRRGGVPMRRRRGS
jgi:hypothetical protein